MIRGLVAVDRAESGKPFEPIVRPRIIGRLRQAASYPIALVVAPAGFGKTVAVRQYLADDRIEHSRFSVRREHATLQSFVRGFVEAIEPLAPNALKNFAGAYERAAAGSHTAVDLAIWMEALLRGRSGTIVVDDLHASANDPRSVEFLVETIARTKGDVNWFIATRDPLELPISSWLAYGDMDMPIDEVDLRLDIDEATETVRRCGIAMRREDIAELVALTDGWPTAFAFALRASTRTADFKRITSGTRDMVYGYLAEQVFRGLSDEERAFLLETAVLPTLDLKLFDAVGRDDVGFLIDRLRKRTAFISVESEDVYRYHELFRDFLERELVKGGKSALRLAQSRAAELLEAGGRYDQALALYAEAQNADAVDRLLVATGQTLFERGCIELLETALISLGDTQWTSSAELVAIRAALHSSRGDYQESETLYRAAIDLAVDPEVRASIVLDYTSKLLENNHGQAALDVAETVKLSDLRNDSLRAGLLATIASASAFVGQLDRAQHCIDQAMAIASRLGAGAVKVGVYRRAGRVAMERGQFDTAGYYARAAIHEADRLGLYGEAAKACTIISTISLQSGDVAAANWGCGQVAFYAERAGNASLRAYALANMYSLAVDRGDTGAVEQLQRQLETVKPSETFTLIALLPAMALQAAWHGDFAGAAAFVRGTAVRLPTGLAVLRWAEEALYAACAGDRDAAEAALVGFRDTCRVVSEAGDTRAAGDPRAQVFYALANVLLGRMAVANNTLCGLEEERQRFHVSMRALITACRALFFHVETGSDHDGVRDALEGLRREAFGGLAHLFEALPLQSTQPDARFSQLTKTEIRVLRALARGASSKGIGEELERSPLTIDSHVKAIVRKLGCSGRREAIALARTSGVV